MFAASDPNLIIGGFALGGLALAGLWRFVVWIRDAPATPDPWDAEVEQKLSDPDAVEVCPHCFTEQPSTAWFCARCGRAVGPYNNLMPFVQVFSEGEVFRNGTSGRFRNRLFSDDRGNLPCSCANLPALTFAELETPARHTRTHRRSRHSAIDFKSSGQIEAITDRWNPPKTLLVFTVGLAHFEKTDFGRANMQPRARRLVRFLKSWVINTFAVLVAAIILRGHIAYNTPTDLMVASLLLGILNAFVRPVLMLLALPLLIFTLGLFTLVINALLLCLVHVMMGSHFQVDSFGFAFLGALIISIVSIALNVLTGGAKANIQIRRHRPPKKPGDDDDDKPVIDV